MTILLCMRGVMHNTVQTRVIKTKEKIYLHPQMKKSKVCTPLNINDIFFIIPTVTWWPIGQKMKEVFFLHTT